MLLIYKVKQLGNFHSRDFWPIRWHLANCYWPIRWHLAKCYWPIRRHLAKCYWPIRCHLAKCYWPITWRPTCYSCWLGSQRKLLTGSWCCSAGCCSSACRDIYTAILERLLFKMEGAKRQRACALPRYRPVVEAVVAALRWRSWLGGARGRLRGWRRDLRRLKSKNECTVGVHTELLSIVQYTFTVHYFAQGF